MLTNMIGGLQGMVDQAMVGNLIGYKANAAIGVSTQIWIIVIIFIASLFTGMSVLVARFAGAGDHDKVDRTVYQAFIAALGLSLLVAPIGYFAAPALLDFVNAAPAVKAEALPFLRIMFLFSSGMLVFFMLGGALRSAGDARTPMILGVSMTVLNIVLNVILIRGLGPIPAFGTKGAAMGTCIASGLVAVYSMWKLFHGGWVVSFPRGRGWGPDWQIIRSLFRFGLPTGIQGIAMNIGGVLMMSFVGSLPQSAAAQAAFTVSYSQLFSFITWTSVGLMGASAAIAGQNLGAGKPERAIAGVKVAAGIGLTSAAILGTLFFLFPRQLLAIFGMHDGACRRPWRAAAARARVLWSLRHRRAHLHRRTPGNGRHQESTLYLDHLADHRSARHLLHHPADEQARPDRHLDCDTGGARDAVRAERAAIQSGQVAHDRGRHRRRSARLSQVLNDLSGGERQFQKSGRQSSNPLPDASRAQPDPMNEGGLNARRL